MNHKYEKKRTSIYVRFQSVVISLNGPVAVILGSLITLALVGLTSILYLI